MVKPHSEFAKDSARAHGIRAYCKICGSKKSQDWNNENYDRYRQYLKDWLKQNADRAAETGRAYYEKHREKKAAAARDWYARNRERAIENRALYRLKNKASELQKMRDYWSQNQELYLAKASRRRASNLAAFRPFDPEMMALLEFEAHALARAREKVTGFKWHVDHIVPITSIRVHSLSGGVIPYRFCGPLFPIVCAFHNEANLAVIPASRNTSKSNRHWPDMP